MAHTDNTAPWWVRGFHAHPSERRAMHARNCDSDPDLRRWLPSDHSHKCDLDNPSAHGNWRVETCEYLPEDNDRRYRYTSRPNRDTIHVYYWGPERAAVRDALRAATKDYRAHINTSTNDADPYEHLYDTDVDIPTGQHRHTPYKGGWWD